MALLGLLVLVAHAETVFVPCEPAYVREVSPSPGAVDVPTDSRIAFVFAGCEAVEVPIDVSVHLVALNGELVPVQTATLVAWPNRVAWLTFDAPLLSEREYRVFVDDSMGASEVSFATGAGPAEPLAGAFSADVQSASWDRRTDRAMLLALASTAEDPARLSVVELLDPEQPDVQLGAALAGSLLAASLSPLQVVAFVEAAEQPDEICALARQVDGAGRVVGEEQLLCAFPIRVGGCSTAASAPAWLGLLGLAFLRRPRRN